MPAGGESRDLAIDAAPIADGVAIDAAPIAECGDRLGAQRERCGHA